MMCQLRVCVGAIALATVVGCGGPAAPTSSTGSATLVEGNYTLNLLATPSGSNLSGLVRICPTATTQVSQDARVVLTVEGNRWRVQPRTTADGAFEMVFDQITGVATGFQTLAGSIRGTVKESRTGFSATSVVLGDGTATIATTGSMLVSAGVASGTFTGATTFSGSQFASFTCDASSVGWVLVKSAF